MLPPALIAPTPFTSTRMGMGNADAPTWSRPPRSAVACPGHSHVVAAVESAGPRVLSTKSRAERYVVDQIGKTARLVQSYGSTPPVITQIGGSVQALPGERTIVSFGTTGRVEEYDATGRLMWHIDGNAGYVFRAQRIRSLYRPGVGSPR